jgi:hypothetical protein
LKLTIWEPCQYYDHDFLAIRTDFLEKQCYDHFCAQIARFFVKKNSRQYFRKVFCENSLEICNTLGSPTENKESLTGSFIDRRIWPNLFTMSIVRMYINASYESVYPGANPTIVSYNASVVNIYNATNSIARF